MAENRESSSPTSRAAHGLAELMPTRRNCFDLSAPQREKIVRLAAEGLSPNVLAARFGVTRDAIYKVLAKPDGELTCMEKGGRRRMKTPAAITVCRGREGVQSLAVPLCVAHLVFHQGYG